MSEVYVVDSGTAYDPSDILGVFATLELAIQYVESLDDFKRVSDEKIENVMEEHHPFYSRFEKAYMDENKYFGIFIQKMKLIESL